MVKLLRSRRSTAHCTRRIPRRPLAHRYLETLPEIANGEASKVWVVPSELTSVVQGLKEGFTK